MNTTAASPAFKKASWKDEITGRQVDTICDDAWIGYFRHSRHLPDGRILAPRWDPVAEKYIGLIAIDPPTGDIEHLNVPFHSYLRVRPHDGKTWYLSSKRHHPRELWEVDLPYGTPKLICQIPDSIPGHIVDITCDGKTLIIEDPRNAEGAFPIPVTMSASDLWRYLNRPRSGSIYAYDTQADRVGRLVHMAHLSPAHSDPSPVDPTLLRYTQDTLECAGQRMYMTRTDASQQYALRKQEYGEMITHEFWWSDPNYIGYTYMDRRNDPSVHEFPWCEYAKRPTHLGICDLQGNEVYLSDPLNSYHAHLYMSPTGAVICGEGTAWNNFICAGLFSWKSTKLDLIPLATIHTPWRPTRGSGTNCAFSTDGKWLFYNDTIDGQHRMCRVKVDL
jgi:hypothetical protein